MTSKRTPRSRNLVKEDMDIGGSRESRLAWVNRRGWPLSSGSLCPSNRIRYNEVRYSKGRVYLTFSDKKEFYYLILGGEAGRYLEYMYIFWLDMDSAKEDHGWRKSNGFRHLSR